VRHGRHDVLDDTGGKNITSPIQGLSGDLLGSDITYLALERSRFSVRQSIAGPGHAKIDYFDEAVEGNQDIVGRDVSMDEVKGVAIFVSRLVRRVQTVTDLSAYLGQEPL
jgi:hypothetical protein